MPPEPLPPWDRKEFYRERKHERSDGLGGSGTRWRDSSHHAQRDVPRWVTSDFRRPLGHGKQGGWHFIPEESHHGYASSRSGEKVGEDESFRPFSRGEGRYARNNRENRGSYNQREWRGHTWETNSGFSNTPLRVHDVSNEQKSREDVQPYSSHSNGGFGNTWDQLRPKDQQEKTSGSNGFASGLKCDGEDATGLNDCKLTKWTRSGSLSSRGSGFSQLSSCKSIGAVESGEPKVELEMKNATPIRSPSGDANACVTSAAALDETTSRKKPRLGWGEGLAKYEKKKVDGPDVSIFKVGAVSASGDVEHTHPLSSCLVDKSPRLMSCSDCGSPATPSSVACSYSPGLEEKSFGKAANIDNDISNLCGSPGPVSQNHSEEGLSFNVEKLDSNLMADFAGLLYELLQSDDSNSMDSGFIKASALNKVLILKGNISKNLEVTESKIDQLETELKLLNSVDGGSSPSASSSLPPVDNAKSCNEQADVANLIPRPAPLQILSSGDADTEQLLTYNGDQEEIVANHKDVDVDSPGTVTSKFVEPLSIAKKAVSSDAENHAAADSRDVCLTIKEVQDSMHVSGVGKIGPSAPGDDSMLSEGEKTATVTNSVVLCPGDEMSHDVIFSSNRELAKEAHEVFSKVLPRREYKLNTASVGNASSSQHHASVTEKFAMRKRFLKFKERVVTIKFKAFQYLWKEDMRLLSIRKHRAKSQKKFELSLRSFHNGYQKHRSSIRSRFSSPAGSISLVPTTEVINFTSKLLLDSQVKLYRDTLKMPALILDNRDKIASRFLSNNGLVEDPRAVEKAKAMMNPWTPTEKEIFMEKFAILGKDFKKIASFLDHKTTADCVDFYYKNHKSDCFEKKKKLDISKQEKSYSNSNYLMTLGKKWNRERNAASLDILGAASVIAAHADSSTRSQPGCSRRLILGGFDESKVSWDNDGIVERSGSFDFTENEREAAAADVLAGICGSLSSEAMSSCITSSADPGDSYREWKSQKIDSAIRRPFTPDVTQNADDETCSDESCGEMDSTDWTDEEKSVFIQAVSSYGRDFSKISQCVRTRSRDQCKVFFSKARKCLGLDMIHPGLGNERTSAGDDPNGSGSGSDNACALEVGSGACSDKSGSKMDDDLPLTPVKMDHDESDPAETMTSQTAMSGSDGKSEEPDHKENVGSSDPHESDACQNWGRPNAASEGDSNIVAGVDEHSEILPVNESESALVTVDTESQNTTTEPGMPGTKSVQFACESDGAERPNSGTSVAVNPDVDYGLGNKMELDENGNASTSSLSGSLCEVQDAKSAGFASQLAADDGSCSAFCLNGNYQHPVSLNMTSKENLQATSLSQEATLASTNSVSTDSGSTQQENNGNDEWIFSTVDFQASRGGCRVSVFRDESQEHLTGLPLLTNAESSQVVLRALPSQMPIQKEMNGEVRCRNPAEVHSLPNSDRGSDNPFTSQACYLQKCSVNLKPPCSVPEFQLMSQKIEQAVEPPKAQSHSLSDSEYSSRSGGDVKLFGKILSNPSSVQKPNANRCEKEKEEKEASCVHKLSSNKSSNLKFADLHNPDGNLKFDPSSYLGLENVRMRSYDYWDGNRLQAAFSSIPDSAILLAKYPAAFGNFPAPAAKIDQPQPLQALVKTTERGVVNSVSVFPSREIGGDRNGLVDYQVYRNRDATKVQPFTVDMKLPPRHDVFSEMQRLNGIENALAGYQHHHHPGRGVVVGRGGIVVGGGGAQCTTGVSDPVAALKLHFAKAEQFGGGQGSSGTGSNESWRGKGDRGR